MCFINDVDIGAQINLSRGGCAEIKMYVYLSIYFYRLNNHAHLNIIFQNDFNVIQDMMCET